MKRSFQLRVPCQEYNADKYKNMKIDEQIEVFVNMYLADITNQDLQDILNQKSYIRFMLFQDNPGSETYMYAYSRPISDMIDFHKEILNFLDDEYVLGEINYSTRGFFYALPKTKVLHKRITRTDVIMLE